LRRRGKRDRRSEPGWHTGATLEDLMRLTTKNSRAAPWWAEHRTLGPEPAVIKGMSNVKGLNNRGQIVGSYTDAVGNALGLLAPR
jgi:hypothetical protein